MSGSEALPFVTPLGGFEPQRSRSRIAGATARGSTPPRGSARLLPFDEVANLPVDATVVVPTYNERETVAPLVRSLERVLTLLPYRTEVLIVDDSSPDGTADVVRRLPTHVPTRVIVREGEKGLASAVIAGIRAARGRACVVMDVDGSHPPDMVPALLDTILERRAEMVLASRYLPGGGTEEGWPWSRRFMSRIATWLARPLTQVRDPMTGFFALDPKLLSRAELSPIGYKIGLEILVRCRPYPILEVPFVFRERKAGRSKMSHLEVLRYTRHLARLYMGRLAPFHEGPRPEAPPVPSVTSSVP